MPKQPGRPRKPRETKKQEDNPQIVAMSKGLVSEPAMVERRSVVLPSDYRATGCTYHGEPVYQNRDGQLVIASGQYVRKSKLDQKIR